MMTDKRSSPVKAIIGPDKVVGLMTEDGLDIPGFDGTGYVTDEELEEQLDSLPIQKGAGHSSAFLKATPNPEDPTVDRTNTVTGAFSAILAGSRNNISATESAAVGGIINIEGGGNNLGAGYRQTLTNCENSLSTGYRNTAMGASNILMSGRENTVNSGHYMFITGRENTIKVGHTSGNPQNGSSIVGGRYNSMEASDSIIGGGQYNKCYNDYAAVFGYRNTTSRQGQLVCGNWNKANSQAYFVVGSGQSEAARKNCFAAGWYSDGATEEDRRVIWIGDTMLSEKQLKALLALLS